MEVVNEQELMEVEGGSLWQRRRNRPPVSPEMRARIERGTRTAGRWARATVRGAGAAVAVTAAIVKAPVTATIGAGVAVASLFFD